MPLTSNPALVLNDCIAGDPAVIILAWLGWSSVQISEGTQVSSPGAPPTARSFPSVLQAALQWWEVTFYKHAFTLAPCS